MLRSQLALGLLAHALVACGTSSEPAPTTLPSADPAPTPAAPTPLATPERFVPANAEARVPAGEVRGVAGTDVVLRVDAPRREPESQRCTVHVVLRAGTDAYDETVACESPIVFHGLTIVASGDAPRVGHDLVAITLAGNGPDEAPAAGCVSDADCVLGRFSCCSAPPCDDGVYNIDVLAALQDRCAHRECAPYEARPCGAIPYDDGPARLHARCVAGTCTVSP